MLNRATGLSLLTSLGCGLVLTTLVAACGSSDEDPGAEAGQGAAAGSSSGQGGAGAGQGGKAGKGGTSASGSGGGGQGGASAGGKGGASTAGSGGAGGKGGTSGGGTSGGGTSGGGASGGGASGGSAGTNGGGGSGAGASGGSGGGSSGAAGSSGSAGSSNPAPVDAFGTAWKPVRIGAGGFLSGLDVAADGTKVVRTDTYGAYLWNGSAWTQLVTAQSMPAANVRVDNGSLVYELRVAPSNSQRLYMAYLGSVYRSDNKGATWTKTALVDKFNGANNDFRTCGQRLAVDPLNADVVYAGTVTDGLWTTSDGGATWAKVDSVALPVADKEAVGGIAFDPSSGAVNGRTKTIYAASAGQGVFVSNDAGASWTKTDGGPSRVCHAKAAAQGGAYFTAGDSKIWRFQNNAWKDVYSGDVSTVLVDPFDPKRVVAVNGGGGISVSLDGGDTWKGTQGAPQRVATDIPWLAWTTENYMSTSDLEFDPIQKDRVWFAEGIGFWSIDLAGAPDTVTVTSQNVGIEQLVGNMVLSPPGGKPIAAAWDRPFFRIDDPDVFPSTHGPDKDEAIQMGWAVDWASSDPTFLASVVNWQSEKSGYSTDGGVTWQKFASYPPFFANGKLRGGIAASTPKNIVWAPSNNGWPYYTQDGGQSWAPCDFPGLSSSDMESGFGWAYWFNRHIVAADRVEPSTFYAYNYLKGVYRSKDGAKSWELVKPGEVGQFTSYHAKLRAVPGHAGHLFFAGGHQGGDPNDPNPAADIPMFHSTDGGATWAPIAKTKEVWDVGFGKPFKDGGYPSIYLVGWVNDVYGIHRSDDEGATWKQVGQWPLGSLDGVSGVTGDMNQAGRVYLSFGGSGFAYGDTAP